MKKLYMILLALSTTILSCAATLSPAGGSLESNGSIPDIITVHAGHAPMFVQTSFGTIGLYVYETPTPMLGIISAPGTISEVSATRVGKPESTRYCGPNTYNTSLLIYGNGGYNFTIVTSLGTYHGFLNIKGLPNYEPFDPRLPWQEVGPVIVP